MRWGRSPPERGRVLPTYQRRRWVRERKGFWAEVRKRLGRGETERNLNFFLKGLDVFTRVLKGKVVFFAVCGPSKAEALDLNGRSGSKEL